MKCSHGHPPALLAATLAAGLLTSSTEPARASALSYVTSFGGLGSGSGQFYGPDGVAVSEGLVYVTEWNNHRVDRFDPSNFAGSFTSFGTYGYGTGQFIFPTGVAVSGGLVYVSDTVNNRIDRFDPNNVAATFTTFGSLGAGPGQLHTPGGLTVSGGLVYVADELNNRIDVFDPNNFAASFTSFGSLGSGPGQFTTPSDVAVDSSGNVFVVDSSNDRIVELAPVPEPSALALWGFGGLTLMVAWAARRRSQRGGG
jgi:DNA-binding beta-propeller fold protein YncE